MKANIAKSSEDSASTIAVTPDSASEVGSQTSGDHVNAGNSDDSNEETVTPSVQSNNKGKGKSSAASVSGQSTKSTKSTASTKSVGESSDGDNLVGKLNNLVTTDLSNITEGRDFLLISEFTKLSPPIILY